MKQEEQKRYYELKDYDSSYFDYLFNLHKDNFKTYFEAHYGKWNDNRQSRSFNKMLSSGNYKMVVFKGEVVGLLNFQPPATETRKNGDLYISPGVLRYLCIDKNFRKQGVGTAIIRDIVGRHNGNTLQLKVYKDNPLAIKLYTKFGFLIDPDKSDDDYIFMFRRLSNRNIKHARYKDLMYRQENSIIMP